jgi:hypothetical protein
MKHRILLAFAIALTIIADIAVILMSYGRLSESGWILLASFVAALVMFVWAARQESGWGAMSLLYFFAEALFLPFVDFYGFSTDNPFFPLLLLPWIFFGTVQFFVVCVRIRIELSREKRVDPQESDTPIA